QEELKKKQEAEAKAAKEAEEKKRKEEAQKAADEKKKSKEEEERKQKEEAERRKKEESEKKAKEESEKKAKEEAEKKKKAEEEEEVKKRKEEAAKKAAEAEKKKKEEDEATAAAAAAAAKEKASEEEESTQDSQVSKDEGNKVSSGSTDEDGVELDYGEEEELKAPEAAKGEDKKEEEGADETMEISVPAPSAEVVAAVARASRHPPSTVVHMRCLVRPFTLPQLRAEIAKHGAVKEGRFWIDSLKSHCIFEMETVDQATAVCGALHGQHWPAANPKTLSVNYSTAEDLEASLAGKSLPDREPHGSGDRAERGGERGERDRERESRAGGGVAAAALRAHRADSMRERERETHAAPSATRVDRKDSTEDKRVVGTDAKKSLKVTLERARDDFVRTRTRDADREKDREERSKRRGEEGARDTTDRKRRATEGSPQPRSAKEPRKEEEPVPPKKMASDFFKITKTLPAIYYLPLTEEEAVKRAEDRKKKTEKRKRSKSRSRSVDRRRRASPSRR
ncbi:hypothetical protein PMAYCL1PPCAC_26429, partial [Pristionchus mayeri]